MGKDKTDIGSSRTPKAPTLVDVSTVLRVVDKLLADQVTRQIYAKDIRMLLDLIQLQTYPPFVVSGVSRDTIERLRKEGSRGSDVIEDTYETE